MKLKEVEYKEIKKIRSDYEFIDRYINKKGIKLYLIRTKEVYETDFTDKKTIVFIAIPKYYDAERSSPVDFTFKITVGTMYQMRWGLNKIYKDFLIHYGFYEFKKWLNEIEEFENQEKELVLLQNEEYLVPNFTNGELDIPYDKSDDVRLMQIAKTNILEAFYKGIEKEKVSSDYLKEICFVPNKIYEFTFDELVKTKLINIESGSLTSDGLVKFRNDNIEQDESRTFSHTVFIAQAFNETMENLYKNVYHNLISEDLKFSPIKINETDPDDPVDVEILNQIMQSRFVICDLTFSRPSVYFEAGYAIARGIKVFFTARCDHNSDHPDFKKENVEYKVHFDLRNRQITWWDSDKLADFKDELLKRIKKYLEYQRNQ